MTPTSRDVAVGFSMALGAAIAAAACPADATPRTASVLLTVVVPGQPLLSLGAADFAALPQTRLTQKLSVSTSASAPAAERSLSYGGVLLRDALQRAGFGGPNDRAARGAIVEAVADDGYRAYFSWGELFNSPLGEQALVIASQDDRPLDAAAGPLALRSLADLRPGPRHVRNLCALVVKRP
jgi:hypothetical protein